MGLGGMADEGPKRKTKMKMARTNPRAKHDEFAFFRRTGPKGRVMVASWPGVVV